MTIVPASWSAAIKTPTLTATIKQAGHACTRPLLTDAVHACCCQLLRQETPATPHSGAQIIAIVNTSTDATLQMGFRGNPKQAAGILVRGQQAAVVVLGRRWMLA